MHGKSEETSANTDHQIAESNPYEKPNVNQQRQVILDKVPDEPPPPPYNEIIQSSIDPKPQYTNPVENSSLNNPTNISLNQRWGRHSIEVLCPNCHTTVRTRVETSSTIITIILAILLALFCLCLGLIPLCMSSCKKTIHYCPNCNHMLGKVDEFE